MAYTNKIYKNVFPIYQHFEIISVPVSSEIRHGVDIRHHLHSYTLRMTVWKLTDDYAAYFFFTLMLLYTSFQSVKEDAVSSNAYLNI